LHDVLKYLVRGTELLLHKKDYDGPDYEEMNHCVKQAKEIMQSKPTVDAENGIFKPEHIIQITKDEYYSLKQRIAELESNPAEAVTDERLQKEAEELFADIEETTSRGTGYTWEETTKRKYIRRIVELAGRKHSATQGEQDKDRIKQLEDAYAGQARHIGQLTEKIASLEGEQPVGGLAELRRKLYEKDKRIAELEGEQKWMSVETPPKESGRYWCYVRELNDLGVAHYQWNCYYDKEVNQWREKSMGAGDQVTHWQPLPSPPSPKDSKTGPGEDYEKKYGGPWER
jgi:uncharacterized coiled-coil protein SlyX